MKKISECRRSKIALVAILCLTGIALYVGTDVGAIALAISGIVGSVAGSNAWEKRAESGK